MSGDKPADADLVVPVVQEHVNVDAEPVVTGGVRVTKRVNTYDETIEQQLRTSRADVKRVKTNRVVDGPQPARRHGNTLIIPVVSEVIHVEKRWVVTEEIHITQREDLETVQQTVPVNYEEATIERVDQGGNTRTENAPVRRAEAPSSIVDRSHSAAAAAGVRPMTKPPSILKKQP
jgi:hypothetical protein